MAEPKENVLMEKSCRCASGAASFFNPPKFTAACNGFWDYGPLGAELKRNVKELWWNAMTRQRDDVAGLEATHHHVAEDLQASGHVDTFSDPMVDCKTCKGRFRADQTGEIPCPQKPSKMVSECHGEKTAPRAFNLMFQTYVGPVQDESAIAYSPPRNRAGHLRAVQERARNVAPEGAVRYRAGRQGVPQRGHPAQFHLPLARVRADGTGIFHQADEVVEAICGKVASAAEAFGVPPSGGPEPAKPELQTLNPQPQPSTKLGWKRGISTGSRSGSRFTKASACRAQRWRILAEAEELAHYARACVDILFKFPFGTGIEGIARAAILI